MYKPLLVLFFASLFFNACDNNSISTDEMREIVKKNNDKLGEYYIAGNAEKLSTMYDINAVIAPNGDDFYKGLQNISHMFANDVSQSKILEMIIPL